MQDSQQIKNNIKDPFIKVCPFCGHQPSYDKKSKTVHCEFLQCAISDFYIYIDEWNTRYTDK